MKALTVLLWLVSAVAFGAPANAAEYLANDQGWSWALGRFTYQWEGPLGRPGAVSRSEVSLVHLEYRFPATPISLETEVLNGDGLWTRRGDTGSDWHSEGTLPPVTLWWAETSPELPLIQAGPYVATGGTPDLQTPSNSTFRVSGGLRARISAKLGELGGYRPFFTLNTGVDLKGQLVVGGSLELGSLLATFLALAALSAQNTPSP